MQKLNINIVEKLLKAYPSEELVKSALKDLKVEKKDRNSRIILFFFCLLLGGLVGTNNDTVIIFQESLEIIMNILLALFGVIFTGYSLLQAFMNKQMLRHLLSDIIKNKEGKEESTLQNINQNFLYLMILYVIAIVITLIIRIVLFCIPNSFTLFSEIRSNNLAATGLIAIYFSYVGIIFVRTVSFLSSIFHLFNIYAVTKVIEMLDEEEKEDI